MDSQANELCGDELHGNIIADFVNGDGGIFTYLAGDAVVKAVIQPLSGLWPARMVFGSLIAFQRDSVNAPVEGDGTPRP